MSEILRFTKADYGINITYTVRDDNGDAMDISSATSMQLRIGRYGKTAATVNISGTFDSNGTDGILDFAITSGTLNITAGYYDAEIRVGYASARRTTRMITLHILDAI